MSITRRHLLATISAVTVLGASVTAHAADTVRIGLPTKTYWPTTIAETAAPFILLILKTTSIAVAEAATTATKISS